MRIISASKSSSSKEKFYRQVEYRQKRNLERIKLQESAKESYKQEVEKLRYLVNSNVDSIARVLLGEENVNLSNRSSLRYGEHGKIAVSIRGEKAGTWYDFASSKGGDFPQLFCLPLPAIDCTLTPPPAIRPGRSEACKHSPNRSPSCGDGVRSKVAEDSRLHSIPHYTAPQRDQSPSPPPIALHARTRRITAARAIFPFAIAPICGRGF